MNRIGRKILARCTGIAMGASLASFFFWYFTIHSERFPALKIVLQYVLIASVFVNSVYFSLNDLNKELDEEIKRLRP